jgi:hypothetical protein
MLLRTAARIGAERIIGPASSVGSSLQKIRRWSDSYSGVGLARSNEDLAPGERDWACQIEPSGSSRIDEIGAAVRNAYVDRLRGLILGTLMIVFQSLRVYPIHLLLFSTSTAFDN